MKPSLKTQDCPSYDQGFCKDGEVLTEREPEGIWVTRMGAPHREGCLFPMRAGGRP